MYFLKIFCTTMAISFTHFVTMLLVSLVLLICLYSYDNVDYITASLYGIVSGTRQSSHKHWNEYYFTAAKLIKQRNELSRDLNERNRRLSTLECEKLSQTNEKYKVASSGGWCLEKSEKGHITDKDLIQTLAQFFKGKYVASFGDGPGRYKQLLLDTGLLKGYDAYDGAPFSEKTSEGRVQYLDLTLPQYGLPLYDWVMSLEVAEHIPQQFESIYLDNIVRHAREGVVLSWAKPGQNGYSHVNNRPFKYAKEIMSSLGFVYDMENSTKLQEASKLDWLKHNTNVFWRKDMNKLKLHELELFWT